MHTSPSLFSRIVVILSATNHFWPFMTTLDGGSCVAPVSADHTITLALASSFAVRWNLKIVSSVPALRIICQPLKPISCYKDYSMGIKYALNVLTQVAEIRIAHETLSEVSNSVYLVSFVSEFNESSLGISLCDLYVTPGDARNTIIAAAALLALLQ